MNNLGRKNNSESKAPIVARKMYALLRQMSRAIRLCEAEEMRDARNR